MVGANYHQSNVLVPGGSSSDGSYQKTITPALLEHQPVTADLFLWNAVSQDHFLLLLRCLHFTNSARAGHHAPLHKIRSIFTGVTSSFHRVFVPYKDLCVDESLMKWKGRLAFCQYIPTKRDQLMCKTWAASEIAYYLCRYYI